MAELVKESRTSPRFKTLLTIAEKLRRGNKEMRARKFSLPLLALAVVAALIATAGAARTALGDDCDDSSSRLEGSWGGVATCAEPLNLPALRDLIRQTA